MDLALLFRSVYEKPRDDVRKQVLADALQQEGDPRGDFIALQLRDSVITRRRSDKLLVRHRLAFLGPLTAAVLNPASLKRRGRFDETWQKGFLTECTVRFPGTTGDLYEWATVETLHVHEGPDEPVELASPRFTSLKAVFLSGSVDFAERARALVPKKVRVRHVDVGRQ